MNSTEKLIHGFRRNVIGAEKTFPIVELDPTSTKIFTEQIRAAKFKGDIVVGYFGDADEWAVIMSDGLIWSDGGQAGVLSIEAVAGARVDLKINKALANAKSLAVHRLLDGQTPAAFVAGSGSDKVRSMLVALQYGGIA
jgi:hypothetical protein